MTDFREVWTDPDNPLAHLARDAEGQVWRSTTGGQAWAPVLDYTKISWAVGLKVAEPIHYTLSKFTGNRWNAIKARLLGDDPDWQEFKHRWATEFGPIGDEVDAR